MLLFMLVVLFALCNVLNITYALREALVYRRQVVAFATPSHKTIIRHVFNPQSSFINILLDPTLKPCTGWQIHSSSSGTSSPHHRNRLQYHRSWIRSSTSPPCTSCSRSARKSRPHQHPRRVQQSAQRAPSGCRTFRSPPGIRHRSTEPGPGCRSWARSGPPTSSSGRSTRLLRRRGR
jgi:hypothetical protein